MSKRTFVCFACRTTDRVSLFARVSRRCRKCRATAEHVYYKFRIPPADDDAGWAELMQKVRKVNDAIKANSLKYYRAKAERHARSLATLPEWRAKKARAQLREVEALIRQYEEWR